jgi:hypothetical protein
MLTIAEVLNEVKRARWDRCIDLIGVLRLYGWVEREDDHADFVVLDVQRYSDSPDLDYTFGTSSPDPALSAEVAAAIGIDVGDHVPCQRIEEVFGGMVTRAIKLAP